MRPSSTMTAVTEAPASVEVEDPAPLGDSFLVVGYPIETVLAEKIVTMIDGGDATTRGRDFADVILLIRRHGIEAVSLQEAITATAAHRGSVLRPLRALLVTLAATRQREWERFTDRSGLAANVPASHEDTIAAVADFADPIVTGALTSESWDPEQRRWRVTTDQG